MTESLFTRVLSLYAGGSCALMLGSCDLAVMFRGWQLILRVHQIFEIDGYGTRAREVVFFTPWYHAETEAETESLDRAEKCIPNPNYKQSSISPAGTFRYAPTLPPIIHYSLITGAPKISSLLVSFLNDPSESNLALTPARSRPRYDSIHCPSQIFGCKPWTESTNSLSSWG